MCTGFINRKSFVGLIKVILELKRGLPYVSFPIVITLKSIDERRSLGSGTHGLFIPHTFVIFQNVM